MIEAVIFDWAGTTVDYGCFAPVQAFLDTFNEKGISVTMAEVREPMGMLKRAHIATMLEMPRINAEFQEKFGRNFNDEDVDGILEVFTAKLMAELSEGTQLKPFLLETVEMLREKGIKIGTTTGYTADMLAPVAKRAAELGYNPDATFTPDDTDGIGRPKPFMVEKNLEVLGVKDKANVIKIGDTISDIEEGKNAGVRSFGVIEGSSVMSLSEAEYNALSDEEKAVKIAETKEVFLKAGADEVLLNLSELVNFI